MKQPLQKSPISHEHAFEIKHLKESYFDPNWHFHSEYQIFIVLKGTGTKFIGDHVSPFKPGEVVVTGPNLPHLWRSDHEYFESAAKSAIRLLSLIINFNTHKFSMTKN